MPTYDITATETAEAIDCIGQGIVSFQFKTIGSGFVFVVEGTVDGENWIQLPVYDHNNTVYNAGTQISPTSTKIYRVVTNGQFAKIRITNPATKTATYAFQLGGQVAFPFEFPTRFVGASLWNNMPSPRTLIWWDWRRKLVRAMLAEVVSAGSTIYHFSNAGNDTTGDGSAGNPYATVAKAQTLMGSGVELRFRYGDIFKEGNGLSFVGRVGSIARAAAFGGRTARDGKPIISKFAADYPTSGWTLLGGTTNVYQRTDLSAATIGWIREKNSIDQSNVLRRVDSTAECDAMEGTWFVSGTTVSIHCWQNGSPATNGRTYEAVQKNSLDGCYVNSTSTNILIENLRFDGWGCNPDSPTSFYGIRIETTGIANLVVVKECEAYYNGRHNIGLVSAGLGCRALFYHVAAGWSTPTGDNPIVDYASSGAQVAIWEEPLIVAGNLPDFTGGVTGTCTPYGTGCPAYVSHGGADTNLSMVYKPRLIDGPYCCGFIGSMQNAPDFSSNIDLARAFICMADLKLRDKKTSYEVNDPWSNAVGMSLISQGDPNTLHMNCNFDCRCWGRRGGPANGVSLANSLRGYYLNCFFDGHFDLEPNSTGGGYRCFFWNSISLEDAKMWNCWINQRAVGAVVVGFEGQCASNNNLTFCSPNLKFRNCVFTAQGPTGMSFYLAVNNNRDAAGALQTGDARSLLNNAYGCNAGKTDTYRGYDQDPYLIEIPMSLVPARPNSDSVLVSSNTQPLPGGGYLEYDMHLNQRPLGGQASAVGPWEASK